ncbi:MAG: ferredoxin [Betaproteobacteria bacterium]|nr:ferredoxin [Betaproteobacteria bacterium]
MAARFQDQLVFHLTGRRTGDGLVPLDTDAMRPALFAGYRDLTRIRHDFPLVLADSGTADGFAASLSLLVNHVLESLAPRGIEGERLRKHVLRLERELRAMLAAGERGSLSELWAIAAARLASDSDESVAKVLALAGDALKLDGELADCDERLPAHFMTHAWRHVQAQKAALFHGHLDNLQRKLSDIVRAAFAHSEAGQQPDALRAAFGAQPADDFDFAAMSRLVVRGTPKDELPAARRRRIEWALSVLKGQRFHASPTGLAAGEAPHDFLFDNIAAAVAAYRERLPQAVELVKAIAIADLEARNGYDEADHGPFFEAYGEHSLTADDLSLFPDTLVCIPAERNDAPENAGLMDMLSSGLPVKVVVQVTDLLEEASIGTGHFAFGVRSARLATTAMGLGGMFVLQAASSSLYRMRNRIESGMGCPGPALFTVFAGAPSAAGELPRYLTAAAAMESRAFPAFVYDAAAGDNWATRFSLEHNRNPDTDWPREPFEYADEAMQRVREQVAFTYADFAMCDRRNTEHFAVVPRDRWTAALIPAADWLELPERQAAERIPYLLAVDAKDALHRVIVDARMMQATRRCLLLWHRLQEHGGIHDSHAERLLAREKATWEAQKSEEMDALRQSAAAAVPAVAAEAAAPGPAASASAAPAQAAEEKPPSDDPWIETARCPSCNECQLINPELFGYNDNKQAFIKDVNAGTFKQLVEAAETCQVAIIHPGKPRNPGEPGLEDLMKRAEAFN